MPRAVITSTPTATSTIPDDGADEGASALAASLSEQLGEDVVALNPRWKRFAQQGVVVQISVSHERFQRRMTLTDLGYDFESDTERKAVERVFKPGDLYLIPWERARRLAREAEKARENLNRCGLNSFFGRWIHLQAFSVWKAEHDAIMAAFLAERDAIITDLDELKAEARRRWYVIAAQNWDRLRMTSLAARDPLFWDRDAWIQAQLDRFELSLPTPETITRKCRMTHKVWMIPTQEQITIDLVRSGDRRLEAAEAAMLDELRASAQRETQGRIEQFAQEVQAQVQGQVFDAVTAALAVIQGRPDGKIGRNSSKALSDMLKAADMLDFWSPTDGSFQANRDELRRLLDTDSTKRSPEDLKRVLQALGAEARLTLMDLDQAQERSGLTSELLDDPNRSRLSQQVISKDAARLAAGLGFAEDVEVLQGMVRRPAATALPDDFEVDVQPAAVRRATEQVLDDDDWEPEVSPARGAAR